MYTRLLFFLHWCPNVDISIDTLCFILFVQLLPNIVNVQDLYSRTLLGCKYRVWSFSTVMDYHKPWPRMQTEWHAWSLIWFKFFPCLWVVFIIIAYISDMCLGRSHLSLIQSPSQRIICPVFHPLQGWASGWHSRMLPQRTESSLLCMCRARYIASCITVPPVHISPSLMIWRTSSFTEPWSVWSFHSKAFVFQ